MILLGGHFSVSKGLDEALYKTEATYESMMHRFDAAIGLDRLHLIHLSDSKKPFASRIDRHSHIGKGKIGLVGFKCFMTDSRLAAIPKIIETPKEKGSDWDRVNLDLLRSLAGRREDSRQKKRAPKGSLLS